MKNEPDRTFLISVHPRWASAFFLSHNPKVIELRKSSFGIGKLSYARLASFGLSYIFLPSCLTFSRCKTHTIYGGGSRLTACANFAVSG
jgi:hypothetical protein